MRKTPDIRGIWLRFAGDAAGTRYTAAVLLILGIGAFLRLFGVGYGLPYVFHPDENRQVLDALGMAQRGSIIPEEFSYPALHKYVLLVVNGAYYALGRVAGWFSGPMDFALKFFTGEASVFLVSRLASVVAGLACGAAALFMALRTYGARAGLIALAFTMLMFHLVQHSQWAIADIFLALFTTLSLYYVAASANDTAGTRPLLLACVFIGLTFSTKPQGAFLVVPLLVSQIYALSDNGWLKAPRSFWSRRLACVPILVVASVVGNLHWFVEPGAAYKKFTMLAEVAHLGISSKEPFTPGFITLVGWFSKEMVRQELILGAIILLGVLHAAVRRSRAEIVVLTYLFVFFFALRGWAIRYLHLFVAIMPVLCVLGAGALDFAMRRARTGVATAVVIVLLLPSLYGSVNASICKIGRDTRITARDWIELNIPEGTSVAMDWYEFSIPIWTDTPVYIQNPKARAYYESSAPEQIRLGYREFVSEKKTYQLVPVIYSTKRANWPDDMPAEAVQRASEKEVYRELYSVFNFRSLGELKRLGAEYLVISSYGYTNFLLDDDPEKNERAVFNYLFKEDLLSFNKQAETYSAGDRFSLLFYLNRRARGFYEPLLRGEAEASLVKEFLPEPGTPGPIIRVYRL